MGIEKYTSWLNTSSGEEAYSHVTDEERARCTDKLEKASAWMYDMLDKQGGLAANEDPAVKVEAIYGMNKEVNDVVSPVMHKPKPKPKKVEEKKEEVPKKGENDSAPEPMDTSEPMESS